MRIHDFTDLDKSASTLVRFDGCVGMRFAAFARKRGAISADARIRPQPHACIGGFVRFRAGRDTGEVEIPPRAGSLLG